MAVFATFTGKLAQLLSPAQAPAAFQKFDQRIDGYIKVILDPQR